MNSRSFKKVICKICQEIRKFENMYEKDLDLNNLQWLICHKTKPNQVIYILIYMYKEDLA